MNLIKSFNAKVSNFPVVTKVGIAATSIVFGLSTAGVHAADPATALDPTTTTALTSGFSSAGAAIAVIIGLAITASVGVIALSGGAKAGLKWIKGVFAKAS